MPRVLEGCQQSAAAGPHRVELHELSKTTKQVAMQCLAVRYFELLSPFFSSILFPFSQIEASAI